jgi:hypothetical protein
VARYTHFLSTRFRPPRAHRPLGGGNATNSIRERLERLAARVSTTKASRPTSEEEDQWRAAIARAKKGNA